MKLLSIGTDRNIFEKDSVVGKRMIRYAQCFEEFHIIVFTKKNLGFNKMKLAENVWVYPTNSRLRFGYIRDAVALAEKISTYDVVTTQDPFETGVAGKRIAESKNIPLHVQVHTNFLASAFKKHSLLNRMRVRVAKNVITYASRVRVVSEKIKQQIIEKYRTETPISVLPIFVDLTRFREGTQSKKDCSWKRVLFVGRLEKEKRPEYALSTLKYLMDKGMDARLTVVGEGNLEHSLKEMAQNLGVFERVTFAGHQDPLMYYKDADVLLVPSLYEGYGLVIAEAVASGTAVISTSVGVAEEAGAVIAPHDKVGFAEKVYEFLSHERSHEVSHEEFLHVYPYKDEKDYIEKWCEDIKNTV